MLRSRGAGRAHLEASADVPRVAAQLCWQRLDRQTPRLHEPGDPETPGSGLSARETGIAAVARARKGSREASQVPGTQHHPSQMSYFLLCAFPRLSRHPLPREGEEKSTCPRFPERSE